MVPPSAASLHVEIMKAEESRGVSEKLLVAPDELVAHLASAQQGDGSAVRKETIVIYGERSLYAHCIRIHLRSNAKVKHPAGEEPNPKSLWRGRSIDRQRLGLSRDKVPGNIR